MRYRSSKKQRKTLTGSLSLDGGFTNSSLKLHEPNSPKAAPKFVCNHRDEQCNCSQVKRELTSTLSRKPTERGRSQSESRIDGKFKTYALLKLSNDHENPTVSRPKMAEIKMYNTKTLPKRIADLKKQRAKTMKETATFYMDLPLPKEVTSATNNNKNKTIDATVLRITESTENLSSIDDVTTAATEDATGDEDTSAKVNDLDETDMLNSKNEDVAIISDLLKEHKEFDRILKKPPKKKSFDNGKLFVLITDHNAVSVIPPIAKSLESTANDDGNDEVTPMPSEPIYESLLRNVHVPYKFSPILGRSISQQHYKFKVNNNVDQPKRPESDYVTLLYAENGELKSVDGHAVKAARRDEASLMRNSDSNINYNQMMMMMTAMKFDEGISSGSSGQLDRQSSFSSKASSTHIDSSSASGTMQPTTAERHRSRKSSSKSHRIAPDRRASDVSDMYRIVHHKQGSEAVGSRMANAIYADPKTLLTSSSSQSNILINRNSVKSDSVFSLTSSMDSVCGAAAAATSAATTSESIEKMNYNSSDSYSYEQSVEDSLEAIGVEVFRDSAIYSDDNNGKAENVYEVVRPLPSPQKSPPPKVPKKPLRSPPPLPNKPAALSLLMHQRSISQCLNQADGKSPTTITATISPTEEDGGKRSDRSWVTKQIKNFDH